MSNINDKVIEYTAKLARVKLESAELGELFPQIKGILDFIGKLEEADTGDIEPTSHILPVNNVFRADEPAQSLPAEDALSGAPRRRGRCFSVPKVIE